MSETTNIAWADSTFNPFIGCTKVGPGCYGCYAEALMDKRMGRVKWGAGEKRQRTSEAYWRQPLAWEKKQKAVVEAWDTCPFTTEEAIRQGYKYPAPWRVFCGSLCDVFDNEVPAAWRWALFRLIRETPHLTWMLLTKRIGNAIGMLDEAADAVFDEFVGAGAWQARGPWPTVWIGATVVNQEEADRDIPKLLQVPAAVRFLSIEPMLGPIDLKLESRNDLARWDSKGRELAPRRIGWCIVGGESDQPGHRARPFDITWARDIVRQCRAANVPVFVKQLGSRARWPDLPPASWAPLRYGLVLKDRAGADPSEWPADLRVREFPR
jgi:protein gp37